jgi:ABC-2 type transport system ATP-binding protein
MIVVEQLRKTFDGRHALDGFSLRVDNGELFGLVGPNGAGKTTLIKILSTLLPSDSGTVQIAGLNVSGNEQEVKRLVGYMPDQPGVYQDMTVREFLEFFAAAFHIVGPQQRVAVDLALQRANLSDRSHNSLDQLSFGMKQRLLLAKTLLHDPKLLLLDEPATGLDPIARIELRKQLQQLNAAGITILISSHILSDLEDICTQIALIGEGRNASDAEGHTVIQLRQPQANLRVYEIDVIGDSTPAVNIISSMSDVHLLQSNPGRLIVEVSGEDAQAASLLRRLVEAGTAVVRFEPRVPGLEERYRSAFGEKRP